jgi:hypothetical protein
MGAYLALCRCTRRYPARRAVHSPEMLTHSRLRRRPQLRDTHSAAIHAGWRMARRVPVC